MKSCISDISLRKTMKLARWRITSTVTRTRDIADIDLSPKSVVAAQPDSQCMQCTLCTGNACMRRKMDILFSAQSLVLRIGSCMANNC